MRASRTGPDRPSLVAGLAVLVLGAVLLADALGAVVLTFAWLAPLACAAVGAVLLALGLSRTAPPPPDRVSPPPGRGQTP